LINFAQSQELLLVSRLAEIFKAEGKLPRDVSIAIGKWYNETLTELQRLHAFSGDEGHLKRAVEDDGSIVDRFLLRLPTRMGLGPYTDWEDAKSSQLLIAKVELAKQGIERWQPEPRPTPGPDDLEERMARALVHIKGLFQSLEIPPEKQKEILTRLLKEISE